MIYENTEKNINDDDNKKELMDPLDYLNKVLVMFDSEQLTLHHCPPIHFRYSDCFCQGSDDKSGSFL